MISLDQCIRLSWRLFCTEIWWVCFHGLQRGHLENPYEKDWMYPRSVHLMEIWWISYSEAVRWGTFRFQMPGVCADAQCWIPHGSKNLLQRAILYRHKRYICVREDCGQYPGETMCSFGMVIWWYLWINVFVWALVFCGPRYGQSASMDCSGVI